jgi:predicted sulfurtransferase
VPWWPTKRFPASTIADHPLNDGVAATEGERAGLWTVSCLVFSDRMACNVPKRARFQCGACVNSNKQQTEGQHEPKAILLMMTCFTRAQHLNWRRRIADRKHLLQYLKGDKVVGWRRRWLRAH